MGLHIKWGSLLKGLRDAKQSARGGTHGKKKVGIERGTPQNTHRLHWDKSGQTFDETLAKKSEDIKTGVNTMQLKIRDIL